MNEIKIFSVRELRVIFKNTVAGILVLLLVFILYFDVFYSTVEVGILGGCYLLVEGFVDRRVEVVYFFERRFRKNG